MNFLKKLDIFLLEKFPLLWHTKLLYAIFFSVVLSGLFYLWGFTFTNEYYVNRFPESRYFEKSNAMLCLFIINAIFIIIWALTFYRKSAVKNLYPLQRFYFTRLLCSFMIIFWSLTWPLTTFNWGVRAKIRKLAPVEELKNHIETINFADAFLFDNSFRYGTYIGVHHPDVEEITFDYNDSIWNDLPTIFCKDSIKSETIKDRKGFATAYKKDGSLAERGLAIYEPSLHPENNDTIEGQLVQFLVTNRISFPSRCSDSDDAIYLIDAKKLKQLCPNGLNDLRNFSKRDVSLIYFEYPQYKNIFDEYASRRNSYRTIYYDDYYDGESKISLEANKSFNAFLDASTKDDLLQLLEKYRSLLIRHKINHSINTKEILDYVLKRQHNMDFMPIVGESSNNPSQAKLDLSRYGNLENYEAHRAKLVDTREQPLYFVEKEQLEDLFSNSQEAHDPAINWVRLTISIFFALGFALIFFLFAISNPINLIIAASVGGVFVILNILFFAAFLERRFDSNYETHSNVEFRLFSQLLIFSAILYFLFYIFYNGKKVSKRLLLITFNLCFAVTILFPAFSFLFLESVLKREYTDSCIAHHTEHSIFYYWIQDPIVIWVSAFSAILLFTHLIKPVLAKPE